MQQIGGDRKGEIVALGVLFLLEPITTAQQQEREEEVEQGLGGLLQEGFIFGGDGTLYTEAEHETDHFSNTDVFLLRIPQKPPDQVPQRPIALDGLELRFDQVDGPILVHLRILMGVLHVQVGVDQTQQFDPRRRQLHTADAETVDRLQDESGVHEG